MNCQIHTKHPMRLCNSFFDDGGGDFISLMARMYPGSVINPLLSTMFTCCEEGAFVWIQLQSKFTKSNEKLFQCKHILLKCHGMDQVVSNVGGYVSTRHNSSQGFCYVTGEDLFGGCKTEGTGSTGLPCECCFVAIAFNCDLLVVVAEIK